MVEIDGDTIGGAYYGAGDIPELDGEDEARTQGLPQGLAKRVDSLVDKFEENYQGSLQHRNPLSEDYLEELTDVLGMLGYSTHTTGGGHNFFEHLNTYVRPRRDTENVDVLTLETEGDQFFSYHLAACIDDITKVKGEFVPSDIYSSVIDKAALGQCALMATAPGAIAYAAGAGSLTLGLAAIGGGAVAFVVSSIATAFANYDASGKVRSKTDKSDSYLWSFVPLKQPHLIAKAADQVVNGLAKRKHNKKTKVPEDIDCLERALSAASFFKYGESQ